MKGAYPPIDVLGIPIPISHSVFLAVLAVHVAVALVAVTAGAVAALSPKRPGRHPSAGTVYFWSLMGVVGTAAVLTAFRPREDYPLLVLGGAAMLLALVGRAARRARRQGWRRPHLLAMGSSYVLMLTAFYVDNGAHLPLWRSLPSWTFWVLPMTVGVPFIVRALRRHANPRAAGGA